LDSYPASKSRHPPDLHAESLVVLDVAATLKLPELPATMVLAIREKAVRILGLRESGAVAELTALSYDRTRGASGK
jgi:hypothetical protein